VEILGYSKCGVLIERFIKRGTSTPGALGGYELELIMMKRLSTLEGLILSNRKIAAAERPENLEKTCVKLSGKTGAKGLAYKLRSRLRLKRYDGLSSQA
jgi:hypothetical protein